MARAGFDAFFAEHYEEVVRALALAVGDAHLAEDAVQDAFASAYLRWRRVQRMERPVGWVVVVAANRVRRHLARAERRYSVTVEPAALAASADAARLRGNALAPAGSEAEGPAAIIDVVALRMALFELPPRQRSVVVLRYLCDLSTDQTADALGCAPGTVRSALHAALDALRVEHTPNLSEEVG